MIINLDDVIDLFNVIIDDPLSWGPVANFAISLMHAYDADIIKMEEYADDLVWENVKFLSGVDTEIEPGVPFHSRDDFIDIRNNFINSKINIV